MVLKLVIVRFDFARLQYLYNTFLIFVLIIAVAAFQPEIRRMLIRIGQAGSRGGPAHRQYLQIVEEIINAVTSLSERKIGAIIVLERRVALGEFTETGVQLDAKVKGALLRTIFHPGSPLHDLAVIIQGDRITAARVQLPLAEAGQAGSTLGSRHRASIGITTGSDAIAIVVSEETGIMSIAEDGKLEQYITEEELRKRLTTILIDAGPLSGRLRRGRNKNKN
jgi:diadenylate cyclase